MSDNLEGREEFTITFIYFFHKLVQVKSGISWELKKSEYLQLKMFGEKNKVRGKGMYQVAHHLFVFLLMGDVDFLETFSASLEVS